MEFEIYFFYVKKKSIYILKKYLYKDIGYSTDISTPSSSSTPLYRAIVWSIFLHNRCITKYPALNNSLTKAGKKLHGKWSSSVGVIRYWWKLKLSTLFAHQKNKCLQNEYRSTCWDLDCVFHSSFGVSLASLICRHSAKGCVNQPLNCSAKTGPDKHRQKGWIRDVHAHARTHTHTHAHTHVSADYKKCVLWRRGS